MYLWVVDVDLVEEEICVVVSVELVVGCGWVVEKIVIGCWMSWGVVNISGYEGFIVLIRWWVEWDKFVVGVVYFLVGDINR